MSYHKCLGRLGYSIHVDKVTVEELEQYRKDCTVVTTVLPAYKDFQKPKTYALYYMSKDRKTMYLPRYYGIEKLGEPDYISLSSGRQIDVKCSFDILPHQAEATSKLDALFNQDSLIGAGGVLSLPCGYGKTFCAIRTVCRLGLSALIVVPTECLMDQWIDAIKCFAPTASVGQIQCDRVDVQDKDFVVAMLHSLSLKDYKPAIFDQFGIAIYDECHHLSSETFSRSLLKIRTKFTLGLSATPYRRDGLSQVFFQFLGPLLHKEKRSGSNTVLVKKIDIHSDNKLFELLRTKGGTKDTVNMVTNLSLMLERNQLIVSILEELIGQRRRILLLSARKQQLKDLKEMLDFKGIRHPDTGKHITYGFYYGKTGMSKEKHRALLAQSSKCDIVLGITNLAKEGLDIPDRNTLVWGTPPGIDVEQPVGRILRKYHKGLYPVVIDFVDRTGNFPNHSSSRNKWFKEEGYIIQSSSVRLEGNEDDWKDHVVDYLRKMPVAGTVDYLSEDEAEAAEDVGDGCLLGTDEEGPEGPAVASKSVADFKASRIKTPSSGKSVADLKASSIKTPLVSKSVSDLKASQIKTPSLSKSVSEHKKIVSKSVSEHKSAGVAAPRWKPRSPDTSLDECLI